MKFHKIALALTLASAAAVTQASAQAVWDSPSLLRPGAPSGLSILLTDSNPGSGIGVLGMWRTSPAPIGVGFRGGISEARGDDVVGVFGIDVSGPLASPAGPGKPGAMWWTGVGVTLADDVFASIPLGLVFGWTATDEGVSFMPYAGGHVVLDVLHGGDDLDLDGVVDLGMDLAFSGGWILRFGASLGGREALAIGFRVPG